MKLKILCLHGHHQSAQRFREKTGALRKELKSLAEFVFIDSPIQEGDANEETSEERQTWFTTSKDNYYSRADLVTSCNKTFQTSGRFVRDFVAKNGPFDGFFAFSQSTAFVHALLKQERIPGLRFVIFCCGFTCRAPADFIDDAPITDMPTFHCINRNDLVVPKEMTEQLSRAFMQPDAVVRHYDCGHCVPPAKMCKTDLREFLSDFTGESK